MLSIIFQFSYYESVKMEKAQIEKSCHFLIVNNVSNYNENMTARR